MKDRLNYLVKKSAKTIKEEGIKGFSQKTSNFIKLRLSGAKFSCAKDVLFINGCTLPHPERYRVDHQIEQLESAGLSAGKMYYEKIDLDMIKYYRCFVFFRCPITPVVEEFIKYAKAENKQVFFDIDDLVIDTKYTNKIEFVKSMNTQDKALYDDGVNRMQKTLKMCDYAITTTEALGKELKNYTKEVYINRNVASEKMVELSIDAYKNRSRDDSKIVIGYLSGSITHNPDFQLILPDIVKIMKEFENVYLKVVGILDIPEELKKFKDRIMVEKFVSWVDLPEIISSLDINLAPLEKSIFNDAKSENKWLEASLCHVITLASNTGAFKTSINDNIDGILVNDNEWYKKLKTIITNNKLRNDIANTAYNEVIKNNVTTYTGHGLAKFISSKLNKNIAFILPTTNISGGVNVVIKHCNILKNHGYDVTIINMDNNGDCIKNSDGKISVINSTKADIESYFDTMVATLWATLDFVKKYPNVLNKSYLVQNYETNFMKYGQVLKKRAESTYESLTPVNYLTISKWCEDWLINKYEKKVKYAPNGIKLENFKFKKRNFDGKIKILIEGNSDDYYKNVDESFKIVELLDKEKFEINYLSYQGKSKDWYYVDNFMHKVPYDEVGKIYQSCDILIKSSLLESFSYPPLEMMATGGLVVVVPNEGNVEYLKDGYNCLFYKQGNYEDGAKKIIELCENEKLRNSIVKNGLETANKRNWESIEKEILKLYE